MKINCYLIFFLSFTYLCVTAQPQLSTEQEIEGITFYQDLKKKNLFYYAPGKLRLAEESNGEPKVQIVLTRYTGTKCGGDQGEKQFLNIVQFTVVMERANAKQLREAKKVLGRSARIQPLSIQNVEAYLVTSIGGEYRRLGGTGSTEGEVSNKKVYWRERTFTLRLNNADAQLLEDMIENDKLGLIVNYGFYVDVVMDVAGDVSVTGTDKEAVEEMSGQVEDLIQIDSTPILYAITADAFPVQIDLNQYPKKLKKIDINETGIPTDYPALEVRCYDFTDDLRPDLNMKEIQIKALGVTGRNWIQINPITFSRFQPDINIHQVQFEYAVKMGVELRYQVIEHIKDGNPVASGWKKIEFCKSVLDVTTKAEDAKFQKRTLDIELPITDFEANGIKSATVIIQYKYKGKNKQQVLDFSVESAIGLQQLSVVIDKESNLNYLVNWEFSDSNSMLTDSELVASDDYIFCKLPN